MTKVERLKHFGSLTRVAMAPLGWLGAAWGLRRLLKWPMVAMVAAIAAGLAWHRASLRDLPDVGDPFNVAAFRAYQLPEARNAFPLYRRAVEVFLRAEAAQPDTDAAQVRWNAVAAALKGAGPWTDPAIAAWLGEHGEALRIWREATDRPESHDPQPERFTFMLRENPTVDGLYRLSHLVMARAAASEAAGDMAGAWEWYRAALRSSRHVGMHGQLAHRQAGHVLLAVAAGPIARWAADPRVDPALVRRALAEARAIDAMTAPASEALKAQYLLDMPAFDQWTARPLSSPPDRTLGPILQFLPIFPAARMALMREPDRSRRVFRLIYANRLHYADRPDADRSSVTFTFAKLHDPAGDPTAPASVRALSPDEILAWSRTSMLPRSFLRLSWGQMNIPFEEEATRAKLLVQLASECYRRDHGQLPETPRALVGPYLPSLPVGLEKPESPEGSKP